MKKEKNTQASDLKIPAYNLYNSIPSLHKSDHHLKHFVMQKQEYKSIIQRNGDPIADALLIPREIELAQIGVNRAMPKLIRAIRKWSETNNAINQAISKSGRDAAVYATEGATLNNLISQWNSHWSIEQTVGLLLDLGLFLRRFTEEVPLINPVMATGRSSQKEAAAKKMEVSGSLWATYLPPGAEVQAGVSATTACLLRTLKHLYTEFSDEVKITLFEIESIVLGAILYWDGKRAGSGLKMTEERRERGLFHTASEVWSVYTQFCMTEVFGQEFDTTYDHITGF